MSARSTATAAGPGAGTDGNSRKWWVLAVLCVAYLMVTLDLTVMNLALPSAQHALGFSNADRQWIVTAYALSFGSLLLFCGRLADLLGTKVTYLTGLTGFAAASAVGGASSSFTMLVTARAVQGAFAALLVPATLSLVATTFTDPADRGKAFGAFGGVAAMGSGVGLLVGGLLTSYVSWRWCLYINLVLAAVAIAGGIALLGRASKVPGARLDVPGVAAVSGGMFCVVYGFSNAATHSWHATATWAFLAAGGVLLVAFAIRQTKAAYPLLPPRVIMDRNRGGAYLTMLVVGAGTYGVFLFLIYYMQTTLNYSPVLSGVALLPMVAGIIVTSNIGQLKIMPKAGPKPLVASGMLITAAAMVWLTRTGLHSGYASALLGPIVVAGLGAGLIYSAAFNTGTYGVRFQDAGIASASVSTGQTLGGAIGTAALNTIAAATAAAYLTAHLHTAPVPQLTRLADLHGYTTVFWWCAAIFAAGGIICGALLRRGPLGDGAGGYGHGHAPAQEPAPAVQTEAR